RTCRRSLLKTPRRLACTHPRDITYLRDRQNTIDQRQPDDERRALPSAVTECAHITSMELDEVANEGETETKSPFRRMQHGIVMSKRLEDDRHRMGRNTESGVSDGELGERTAGAGGLHVHSTTRRSELDGILQEIPEDLFQPGKISVHEESPVGVSGSQDD